MNASVESIPVTPRAPPRCERRRTRPTVRERRCGYPGRLTLYHGGDCRMRARLACRGRKPAPVVCALAASPPTAALSHRGSREGWWSEVVGPGVLSIRVVSSVEFRTISAAAAIHRPQPALPAPAGAFPSISSYDRRGLVRLLDHLAWNPWRDRRRPMAACGAARRFRSGSAPDHHRAPRGSQSSLATAWRSVQRRSWVSPPHAVSPNMPP